MLGTRTRKGGIVMQFSTMAGTAVGMAVGAAAVCLATQDQRMMRKTVHKLAKGAEHAVTQLDDMVSDFVERKMDL